MPLHNFERLRGRIVELSLASDNLRGNLLGDPDERTIAVYLPPEYEAHPDARFPVLVDLAAFTSSGLKRLAWTAFGESVPQRVDRLIAEGRMGPALVVFPDAFTSLGGNQYVDTPVLGAWERFLLEDLVPAVEQRFRALPGPRHRAVYGKSSGGYGALRQAMLHAEHWAAIASHSGDVDFELAYRRDFPATADVLARFGGDVAALHRSIQRATKISGSELHALMIVALAASYDPTPDAPLGAVLPFDLHTCTLDSARWARWLAHDPLRMVEQPAAQERLRSLRLLYFDCGRRDEYFLHYGNRALARRLGQLGIEHVYDEFDDSHSSTDYRLDVSLPRLYEAIRP